MEIRYPIGTRYILLAMFGSIFLSSSYLIYVYEPSGIIIRMITNFSPDSTVFNLWKDPPLELLVKIYIFNVTNPEEFLNGQQKLKIQEVGPYSYRESMYNINTTFYENGTLSFIPKRKVIFSLKDSIGDAAVDRFILPNIAFLGLTSYLQDSSMFTNIAFRSLTSYLGSQPFVNLTVEDYLMGYDDSLVKLANTIIPNWIDFERLGILDRVMAIDNSSELVTMNIKREPDYSTITKKKSITTYAIERWGGSLGLRQWGYIDGENETHSQNTQCNSVEGTSIGTVFPLNMDTNETIRLYRRSFCRPAPFIFHKSSTSKDGYDINIFKVDERFLLRSEYNDENSCYCHKANPDDCLPNGVGDLSPCYYGIPVAISQPHFLNADPSVLEKIEGLLPDREKHDCSMSIHPGLGIPLEANFRVQINLVVPETKYNSKTKPFNNHIVPLFWSDLSINEIPSELKLYITILFHVLPISEKVIMYVLSVMGVLLICYSSSIAVLIFLKNFEGLGIKFGYSALPLIDVKENPSNDTPV